MSLKRIEKIKTSEALTLLSWLSVIDPKTSRDINYTSLLNECISEESPNEVDVDGYIDELMYKLFTLYDKLKNLNKDEVKDKMSENSMLNILPKDIVEESMKGIDNFISLYERILMEAKFDFPNIRGIQKNILTTLMNQYILNEEYEKCADIKTKLNEL